MNIWTIIAGTGIVVKAVLVMLIIASVISWSIILSKYSLLRAIRRDTEEFLDRFWNGKSLDAIYKDTSDYEQSPLANIFRAAYQEFAKVSAKKEVKASDSPEELLHVGMDNVERVLKRPRCRKDFA